MAFQVKAGVTLFNLGTLGGDFSSALAINDRGEIVGWGTHSDGTMHAFRYEHGLLSELNARNSDQWIASAINDAGQIVGSNLNPFTNEFGVNVSSQAVSFDRGLLKILVQGTNYSSASGINNSGQIAGTYGLPDGTTIHAFVYKMGLMTDLGTLGGDYSEATGINNRGEVVGLSNIDSQGGPLHPFLYRHGLMQDLGTFGGTISAAYAVNDLGEVVGYSTTPSNLEQHPFLYRHGRMYDLGTLGGSQPYRGGNYNYAAAINNWGQVVGQATTATGAFHAFLYNNGKMTDLNNLVKLTAVPGPAGLLVLISANGINDRGEIVGAGAYWDGAQVTDRAYLLKVQP